MPMLANLAWPLMVAMMVLALPAFRVRQANALDSLVPLDLALLLPCTLAFVAFYAGLGRERGLRWPRAIGEALLAMLLAAGLCVNNCRAALLGLFGGHGEFIRTPKRGDGAPVRIRRGPKAEQVLEAALAGYLLVLCTEAIMQGVYLALPFPLFFVGAMLWASSGLAGAKSGSAQ